MKCREIFDKMNEENKSHQEKLSQKIKESNNNLKDILKKIKVQMEKISNLSDLDDYEDGRSYTETTYSDINANHIDLQTIHVNELKILSQEKKNEKIIEELSNDKITEESVKEDLISYEKDEESIYHQNKNLKKIILNVLNADMKQYLNSKIKNIGKLNQNNLKKYSQEDSFKNIENNLDKSNEKEIKKYTNKKYNDSENNNMNDFDIKDNNKKMDNKLIEKKNENYEINTIKNEVNINYNDLKNKNKNLKIKHFNVEVKPENKKQTNFANIDVKYKDNKLIKKEEIILDIKNLDIELQSEKKNNLKVENLKNDKKNYTINNFNIELNNLNTKNQKKEKSIQNQNFEIKNNDMPLKIENNINLKNQYINNIEKSLNKNNKKDEDNKRKDFYQMEISHNEPINLNSKENKIVNDYCISFQSDINITNCSSSSNRNKKKQNDFKISLNDKFDLSPKNIEKNCVKEEYISFQPYNSKNNLNDFEIDSFSISSVFKKPENIININEGFSIKGHGKRIENVINLLYFPEIKEKDNLLIEKKEIEIQNKKETNQNKNDYIINSNNINFICNSKDEKNNNNNLIILNNKNNNKRNNIKKINYEDFEKNNEKDILNNKIIRDININFKSLNPELEKNLSPLPLIKNIEKCYKNKTNRDKENFKEILDKKCKKSNTSRKNEKNIFLLNKTKSSNSSIQEKCNNNFKKKIKTIFQREDEIHLQVKDLLKKSRQHTENQSKQNLFIPSSNSQYNTGTRTNYNTQELNNFYSSSSKPNESLNENSIENYNFYDKINNQNINEYYKDNNDDIYNNIYTYKSDDEDVKNNNYYDKMYYEPEIKEEIKTNKKSHSVNPNKMRNTREEYFNLKNQIELLKKERDFLIKNNNNIPENKLFLKKKIKKLKKEKKINLSKSTDILDAQMKADKYFEYKLLEDEIFKRLELNKLKEEDNLSENSLLKSHDSFGEYVDKIIKKSYKLFINRQCNYCAKLLSQGKPTSLCNKRHHRFQGK